MTAQILYVSKPVVPPYNDGSKCLVRDLSGALTRYEPRIMVPRDTASPDNGARLARVYAGQGGYRPALVDNLRVLYWLLLRAREDLWNFVFAPNVRTSQIGRLLRRLRKVPVVQTVASPPRSFTDPTSLLFGDIVVTQSTWTKSEFLKVYASAGMANVPRIEVVAPSVPWIEPPSRSRCDEARAYCGIEPDAPVIVYPGDLEVSHGAEWVAAAIAPVLGQLPKAVVVFAYRHKSPHAIERAKSLESALASAQVRFVAELPDMHALLATTNVLLFPVDNLYGKVDLPIVVLEAMHLGVPVVTLDQGPLADLQGVVRVPPGDSSALARCAVQLIRDAEFKLSVARNQREAIERNHRPAIIAARYEAFYDDLLGRTVN